MDLKQTVEIPLEEYLELKSLEDHQKFVKLEETTHHFKDGKEIHLTGNGTSWKSDGAIWNRLTAKISSMGSRFDNIFSSTKSFFEQLEHMSYRDFKKMKKELRKVKSEGGMSAVVNEYIKGW